MRITAAGHFIILDPRIQAKHLKRWTFWNLLKTDIFDRGVPWIQSMLQSARDDWHAQRNTGAASERGARLSHNSRIVDRSARADDAELLPQQR